MTTTIYSKAPLSDGLTQGLSYASLLVSAAGALGFAYYKHKTAPANDARTDMEKFMAKGTQHWLPLGLSYYVGAMGVWALIGFPEIGTQWGWWGVIGYAVAVVAPFYVMMYLGPRVRHAMGDAYSLSDWAKQRYGRGGQFIVGATSLFYMFIFMTAELSSTASVLFSLGGVDSWASIVPMALVTLTYSLLGGLEASILTDRVQSAAVILFTIVLASIAGSKIEVKQEHWYNESQSYFDTWFSKGVSHWRPEAFDVAVTLVIAVVSAEMFNNTSWQRVWAAKDNANLKKSLIFAQALLVPTIFLLGILGMLAEAQDRGRDTPLLTWDPYVKHLAFFDLLRPLDQGVIALTVVLAVCMAASSIDSLQNAMMSVMAKDFELLFGERARNYSRLALLVLNIVAIFVAQAAAVDGDLNLSWLNLFLLADVIACAVVMPLFMGLFDKTVTTRGFYCGVGAGFLVLMGWGWAEFGSWLAGLEMITLMAFGGRIDAFSAGLYAPRTPIVLTLTVLGSALATWFVSAVDNLAENARMNVKSAGHSPSASTANSAAEIKAEKYATAIESK